MTNPTADSDDPSPTMVAQLLTRGEALHGAALSVYAHNYPQGFWRAPIVSFAEIGEDIQNSHYGDVLGLRSLRERLAVRDAARRSQPYLSGDNVAVTQGGTHALQVLLRTFGARGGEVLIPVPSYSGYRDICQALKLPYRPYTVDDSGDWLTEELLCSLRPSSIMIVNTPHNPSGIQMHTDQLARLVKRAQTSGSVLIFDCVYDELVYEDVALAWNCVFQGVDDLGSCIWVNSFSKNYGLPGVRLGWITASAAIITRLEAMIETSVLCLPDFIQRWATLAIDRLSGALTAEMKARRDYLCVRLSALPGLDFTPPASGVTLMARLRNGTGMELVEELLNSKAALFLPGSAYYGGDPQTIRLSFGYPLAEIDKYVAVLASVLERDSPLSTPHPARQPTLASA